SSSRSKAAQMSLRSASNQPRARVLRSSISDVSMCLALWPEISAALVATVAVNADAGDFAGVLDPLPDEARQVFQRRRSQRFDLVQELVVERLADLVHAAFEQAEIEHHAGCGIGGAAHAHFGAKGVAVDFLAGRAKGRSLEEMRSFKAKRFRQFPHLESPGSYLMPSVLYVCRLSRHCGCRRQ